MTVLELICAYIAALVVVWAFFHGADDGDGDDDDFHGGAT